MLRSRLLNYCSTAFHGIVKIGRTTWTLNTFFLLLDDYKNRGGSLMCLYVGSLNHLEQLSWFQLLS